MDIQKIAVKLTAEIFDCGSEPDSPCNRIQFMGGSWLDKTEVGQGGFGKDSLAHFIEGRLIEILDKT